MAEEEELQESEVVVWPDSGGVRSDPDQTSCSCCTSYCRNNKPTEKRGEKEELVAAVSSSPLIPIPPGNSSSSWVEQEEDDDDDDDDDERIPPHVMIARRITRKMAFSVCTGYGRTLKGRDLSRVRNSILRMTGFLETCE